MITHTPNRYAFSIKAWRISSLFLILAFIFSSPVVVAQSGEKPPGNTEQQLENITERNNDVEIEDDSYLQQMQEYLRHPVNLNYATANELKELHLLNPLQVQNLVTYRMLLGNLIDIYELQAVPGWDVALIAKLRPYISVTIQVDLLPTLKKRFRVGENVILIRMGQTLERSKGYLIDSPGINHYAGSPQKILLRYKYHFKQLLQYGIVAEKDAGEQWFKGNQKQGFDFYSIHFFARQLGIIRAFALGDFTVNMGQGLIQWQSLAFKKSVETSSIKREAAVLQPYTAAGEIDFHRGAGITLGKRSWQTTLFISYKKTDANFIRDSAAGFNYVSSLQTSGYHRTHSEIEDKGVQRQLVFGGNLSYQLGKLHVGVNAVHYAFKWPLIKSDDPYNLYALTGKKISNTSIDYSYTFKNMHFFGEAALLNSASAAFINGLLLSVAPSVDMSFLYRNLSPRFQSLYATAFTENSFPSNEKGLYLGLTVRPATTLRLDAYVDFFQFPWLKYGVNAPSGGKDYLLQFTCQPNKQVELYTRFHVEEKTVNDNPAAVVLLPVVPQKHINWRTQFSYTVSRRVALRSRAEINWIDPRSAKKEQGFLIYADFIQRHLFKSLSGNLRVQYFETGSYLGRIYAYENDVMFTYSIPVFYDKGLKYYVNINYDIKRQFSLWLKWSQMFYPAKSYIGSGLDEIKGSRKSEIRIELVKDF